MSEVIADGKVVSFHYTLRNDAGEVLDSSSGGEPLSYLHGAGSIVPGLENQLTGQAAGAKLRVTVPAGEGYGEYQDELKHAVSRNQFPPGVDIQVGMQFGAQGPNGEQMAVWVREVTGDSVTIDFNHPLAGQALHFEVEVVSLRESSDAEREHGHAHGAHGHDHGHGHDHDHGHGHGH